MKSKLFDTGSLGGIVLKNRFVRSATWEGMAHDDGSCTPALVDVTSELAKGEVALIVSSHTFVSPEGQAGSRQLAVYTDRFTSGLSDMAKAAHDGGSKVVLQLAHAGVQADTSLTKREAVGPSSLSSTSGPIGRAMTPNEIERVTEAMKQRMRKRFLNASCAVPGGDRYRKRNSQLR